MPGKHGEIVNLHNESTPLRQLTGYSLISPVKIIDLSSDLAIFSYWQGAVLNLNLTTMKQTTLILNIGLNVGNVEPEGQLVKTVLAIAEDFKITGLRLETDSEYNGIPERTLIVAVETDSLLYVSNLMYVAHFLKQESIAYLNPETQQGDLIFSPTYTGEGYDFDIHYFKHL